MMRKEKKRKERERTTEQKVRVVYTQLSTRFNDKLKLSLARFLVELFPAKLCLRVLYMFFIPYGLLPLHTDGKKSQVTIFECRVLLYCRLLFFFPRLFFLQVITTLFLAEKMSKFHLSTLKS